MLRLAQQGYYWPDFFRLFFLAAIYLSLIGPVVAAQTPKVVFISPAALGNGFWDPATVFMQHAAKDLAVELEVIYTQEDHLKMIEEVKVLCRRAEKPDYLILVNHRDATPIAIRHADNCGIKSILFNGAFSPKVAAELRYGTEALKYWVGAVLPDEAQSGYLLAEALVERARVLMLSDDNGKIHIVGVNGALRSFTSTQREAGLRRYVDEQEDLELAQVVHAFWSKDTARELAGRLLNRYPATSIIWSASDSMAVGVAEAIIAAGKRPGKDVLTAGVDWIPEAHKLIDQGLILGSVGGHVFDGAWVMVKLLDHYGGHAPDFFTLDTAFAFADDESIGCVEVLLDNDSWGNLDFRRFSRFYGNETPDSFGADLILNQLGSC